MQKLLYTPEFEVRVNVSNVSELFIDFLIGLEERYGPRLRDELESIAVGPNMFKAIQLHEITNQRLYKATQETQFYGINITCSPLPFPIPCFKGEGNGWYFAHCEAQRAMERLGVGDA